MDEFENEDFVVEDWINAKCKEKPDDETMEKYLAALEMKLRLQYEDLQKNIEDSCTKIMRDIPDFIDKAEKMKSDIEELKNEVIEASKKVKEDKKMADEIVSPLAELDSIKKNIENTCQCIKEATELTELFVRVDDVFSKGNIFEMSEIFLTMKNSMDLVGEIPEFMSKREKLKELEERLVSKVKPVLTESLIQRNTSEVNKLFLLFKSLNQLEIFENAYIQYCKDKIKMNKNKLIDNLTSKTEIITIESYNIYLKEWYDALVFVIEEELSWVEASSFGDSHHAPEMILKFIYSILNDINIYLNGFLKQMTSYEYSLTTQDQCMKLYSCLERLFSNKVSNEKLIEMSNEVFSLIEKQIQRFVLIEKNNIMNELDNLGQSLGFENMNSLTGVQYTLENRVKKIRNSIKSIYKSFENSIERCHTFTGHSELNALINVIDGCIDMYHTLLVTCIKDISTSLLPLSLQLKDDETKNIMEPVISLLQIISDLEKKLKQFKQQISLSIHELDDLFKNDYIKDMKNLSPMKLDKEKLLILKNLILQNKIFVDGERSLNGLKAAVEALVFNVLMDKLRNYFKNFSELSEWTKSDIKGEEQSNLPQFSNYPLSYITSSSEYLMMLPPQLEALVDTETINIHEDHLATIWLEKIVIGAAEYYADEILQIKIITENGIIQLITDIEYFSNVLKAMGYALPTQLSYVLSGFKLNIDELKNEIDNDDNVKNTIYKSILKMRSN